MNLKAQTTVLLFILLLMFTFLSLHIVSLVSEEVIKDNFKETQAKSRWLYHISKNEEEEKYPCTYDIITQMPMLGFPEAVSMFPSGG